MFTDRKIEKLSAQLKDPSAEARRFAAERMGKFKDPRTVAALIRTLCDGSGDVRKTAAESLEKLGEPKWNERVRGDFKDFCRLGASGDREPRSH